jgi:hypothetical protein
MKFINNLEKWQIIVGALLATVALGNLVPNSLHPMTRGAHEEDSRYTQETVAAKNIQYFEKKVCGGKALSTFRLRKLNEAYNKFEEVAGEPFPLQALTAKGKCRALKEDDI